MTVKRSQTLHEELIPLMVLGVGAERYLEFGTHLNETIGRVDCRHRFGVDVRPLRVPGIRFFEMSTAEFIAEHAPIHGPFDFVFIDADHSADAVWRDFQGIWPYVTPEGLVLLHDTNPASVEDTAKGFCGDAWEVAQALKFREHEAVTLPYHPGLTIIRKRITWGPLP